MTADRTINTWIGIKGRIGAYYLNSSLRRLSEVLFLGDCKPAFLSEVSDLIHGNEVVLDVGAGSGYYSLEIAKKLSTGKVICLDLSDEMLSYLSRKAEKEGLEDRIQILKGESSSSGLGPKSVDLVVSNGLLHELPDSEAVLREMLRVLKPEGWLIISDFRDTRLSGLIEDAHSNGAHGPFSINELENLFTRNGLKNLGVRPVKQWVIGKGQK